MNLKSENSSVGWMGPSSLVRHILALRHRKYELYAPMKMQTEPYKNFQLANRLSWSAKKGQTWPWQTCSTNWINEDVCRYFVPRYTFDWILLIAFKRVGVAISQLVKFNLQDLQLMNNIEENIAATPQIHSGREQSDSGCGITIHNQRPLRFFRTNGLDHTWKLKSRHFVLIYTGASMVGFKEADMQFWTDFVKASVSWKIHIPPKWIYWMLSPSENESQYSSGAWNSKTEYAQGSSTMSDDIW